MTFFFPLSGGGLPWGPSFKRGDRKESSSYTHRIIGIGMLDTREGKSSKEKKKGDGRKR